MKSNTKSISRLIVLIFILIMVILGGTFAWLTFRSNKTALVLTIGDINKTQVTIMPYQLNINSIPSTQYNKDLYSDVNVTNNSNSDTSISLVYKSSVRCKVTNDTECENNINNYPSNLINYKIVSKTSSDYKEVVQPDVNNTVKEGTITPSSEETTIFDINVSANENLYYRVYVWADGTTGDTSEVQGTELSLELNASIAS